ncbi:class I adenylate-forming enzyme family protein [Streptomyces sp. NPDC055078]
MPVFDTEVQIRAADGETVLPAGEKGEIWARGPQIADGYHDDPVRTAEQFRDGWLRTGDLAWRDEDGWVFLAGREKDMLIYKGYNVYPHLLEEILGTHPAVAQSSVVGAAKEGVGEIPVAFVITRPGADKAPGLADALMAYVAERVAPYHRVRELHLVDALPVSPTGKVLKRELRARLDRPSP